MLIPVSHVNPGIRKYQQFYASFCTIIQDEPDHTAIELNFDHG